MLRVLSLEIQLNHDTTEIPTSVVPKNGTHRPHRCFLFGSRDTTANAGGHEVNTPCITQGMKNKYRRQGPIHVQNQTELPRLPVEGGGNFTAGQWTETS